MKKRLSQLIITSALALASTWAIASTDVELQRGELTLYGSLNQPDGATELVIIHAGSGPTDRNGNQATMQNNSLLMVAEGLAEAGVAVLAYDKRASGATGMVGAETNLRPSTYMDDLAAWVDWARTTYPDLGVHLLGHSEGALFALAVGQTADISSVISLAGAGRPAAALLREQTEGRLGPLAEEFENTLNQLEAGVQVDEVNPMLVSLFRPSVQPYLIEWLAMDPAALATTLPVPLLVVSGSTDIQVVEADYQALSASARTSAWIEGMNHVLKSAEGNAVEQMPSYTDPELPLHPELMPVLNEWVSGF